MFKRFHGKEEGVALMNRPSLKSSLVVVAVCFFALLLTKVGECSPPSDYLLTDAELDGLLAPIALYPDPLLAQILPASTYPSEIVDAAAWIGGGGDISGIDGQDWDESVKAIAYYPDILDMMAENIDWTSDLGYAFLNQPDDVMSSIQRLRWQARALGNLESDDQETVSIDGDYIEIVPAQPEYIYVPLYNPTVIYVRRWARGIPLFMTFGRRMQIGGWLSMDFDWHNHHVIYHGWSRPGWVNKARPYVHIKNLYINGSRPGINQTWRHDASHGDPDRYRASLPGGAHGSRYALPSEVRGRDMTPGMPPTRVFGPRGDVQTFSNRGRESLGAGHITPSAPVTVIGKPQTISSPRTTQTFGNRGKESPGAGRPRTVEPITAGKPQTLPSSRSLERPATPGINRSFSQPGPARVSVQPARTSSSVFGDYRGNNETRVLSNRGQTSLRSSAGTSFGAASAGRGGAPAVGQSPVNKKGR
jgi:hypothetical protein